MLISSKALMLRDLLKIVRFKKDDESEYPRIKG